MSELDKLEEWLKAHGIRYERTDSKESDYIDRHQIIVYEGSERVWDVICQKYSYGYERGLLEAMGNIVKDREDDVEGYLTAAEIIGRMWRKKLEAVL